MKPCKHCGGRCFTVRTRVTGYWNTLILIRPDGTVAREGIGDDVRESRTPKRALCDQCGKFVPYTQTEEADHE